MANITILGLDTLSDTPASNDYLVIWDAGSSSSKKLAATYYEPADNTILKEADFGTGAGQVAEGNHDHLIASLDTTGATSGYVFKADGTGGGSWSCNSGSGLSLYTANQS